MVGPPHPAGYKNRYTERVKNFANCGKTTLGTDDHDRVIFSDISPCHHVQALGARGCADRTIFFEDVLDDITGWCPDICQKTVTFLGGVKHDPALFYQVMNFKNKTFVHRGVDDKTGCIKRVSKNFVKEEVPSSRLGFVSHKYQNRITPPLFKFHLGNARSHTFDVA